jgi:hypothetical protein
VPYKCFSTNRALYHKFPGLIVLFSRQRSRTYLDLTDFSGSLILPVPPLLQRPVKLDSTGPGTIVHAAAAVPAFVGVQYDRRFSLYRIGHEHVYLADIYTGVTTIADIRIKDYRLVWRYHIRHGDYFTLSHLSLQKPVCVKGINLIL